MSLFFNQTCLYIYKYIYIYIYIVTIVEGEPKAPFLIATIPRCRRGRNSFPWIDPLYSWSLPYNAECYARRHQVPLFESLVWLSLGLNHRSPGTLANTVTTIRQCLSHSIIRYGSSVKWSNPGKGVAPSPTPWCSSYRKESLRVTLSTVANTTYLLPLIYIYIYIYFFYLKDLKKSC